MFERVPGRCKKAWLCAAWRSCWCRPRVDGCESKKHWGSFLGMIAMLLRSKIFLGAGLTPQPAVSTCFVSIITVCLCDLAGGLTMGFHAGVLGNVSRIWLACVGLRAREL